MENAAVNFEDSLSGLKMNVVLEELNLQVDRLNLSRQEAGDSFRCFKRRKNSDEFRRWGVSRLIQPGK